MKKSLVLLAVLPLSGCISFAAEPPPSLLTLTAAQALPAGQSQSSAAAKTITIAVPAVSQALATTRVPVQASDTAVTSVKALRSSLRTRRTSRAMQQTSSRSTTRS